MQVYVGSNMAEEEYIVISDEEETLTGAEIISSDDESHLSSVNSTNSAQPMIIGADPQPEDEQINGSVYAHYTHEAVVVQGISSRGSDSQLIALPSRQASVCIVVPPQDDEPQLAEQQRGRGPLRLESVPAPVITLGDISSQAGDQSYSPRVRSSMNSTLGHNSNAMTNLQPAKGANQATTKAGCAQAIPVTQKPGDGNKVTEGTIQVTTAHNSHDTNRSLPIVVSESPPRSVIHMNPHVTTTSISSGCSAANQGSGTIHSIGAASTQVVGSTSRSTQPIPSQMQQITVNARVLDQVVKLAAFSCASLHPQSGNAQQHEFNLYRLLTNAEAPQGEPRPALSLLGATSGVQGNTSVAHESETPSRTSTSSSGGSTMEEEVICISAASSEPIILDANQSPEKSDTHTGVTPIRMNTHQTLTSTPTTESEMEESISLTTRSSSSMDNESSFNSILTEVTLSKASFHDKYPTLVPDFHGVLRREISNESTWSQHSAPPRKRLKMMDRNQRAQSVTICGDEVVPINQALGPTPGLAEINNKEVMITNQTPPGRDSHATTCTHVSIPISCMLHVHPFPEEACLKQGWPMN